MPITGIVYTPYLYVQVQKEQVSTCSFCMKTIRSRRGIPVTGSLFLMLSLLFFIYCASSSLKGSPHSGQNFGGLVGSSGTQPHLSHLYLRTAAGLAFPHSTQNFPLLTAPQEQVQLPLGAAGFGFPHSGQNFPVAVVPQEAHTQLSAAAV